MRRAVCSSSVHIGNSLFGSNEEEGEESGDDEDSEDEGDNDH